MPTSDLHADGFERLSRVDFRRSRFAGLMTACSKTGVIYCLTPRATPIPPLPLDGGGAIRSAPYPPPFRGKGEGTENHRRPAHRRNPHHSRRSCRGYGRHRAWRLGTSANRCSLASAAKEGGCDQIFLRRRLDWTENHLQWVVDTSNVGKLSASGPTAIEPAPPAGAQPASRLRGLPGRRNRRIGRRP